MFKLYHEVITHRSKELHNRVATRRSHFLKDKSLLKFIDPKTDKTKEKTVSEIAKRSTSSLKFQVFLVRLIEFIEAKRVLEAGTSVGVSAATMALTPTKITTIEGSKSIAEFAKMQFEKLGLEIDIVEGNIFDTFFKTLIQTQPDLVFIDADHRGTSIQFYLDQIQKVQVRPFCIILHDIYWSSEMYEEWKIIQNSDKYNLTIDIFEAGLIFPDFPMEKQHFILRF